MARSSFRFVKSSRHGSYSVWRGDVPIGYVTKSVFRTAGMTSTGYTKTERTIWTPATPDRRELATELTREDGAKALWADRQRT